MYIQPSEAALSLLRTCACNVEIDEVPEEFIETENCTHMTFWSCPENGYQFNLFKFNLNMMGDSAYVCDFKFMSDSQVEDRARYEKFLFITLEAIEKYCKNEMSASTIKIYTGDYRVVDAYFEYNYQLKIHTGEKKNQAIFIGIKNI